MNYETIGIRTSDVEVTDVSPFGIWLLLRGKEYFLSFKDFPWFQDAPVKDVFHAQMESENHLRWPDLDIDLTVESIQDPGTYPLVYEPKRSYRNQDQGNE